MFELKDPTKAKLRAAKDKAVKMGQKELVDHIILHFSAELGVEIIDRLDGSSNLREVLYARISGKPTQATIDGVEAEQLTSLGAGIKTFSWHREQTGCVLTLDYGMGGERSNMVFRDCVVKDLSFELRENKSRGVLTRFAVHAPTSMFSDDQLGKIHRMHQRSVEITLAGPNVLQADIEDGDAPPKGAGQVIDPVTPIGALTKAVKGNKRDAAPAH